MRNWLPLGIAVMVNAGVVNASAQQPTNPAVEAVRVQDVYAVYSALMSNAKVIGGDSNRTYAFAAVTAPAQLEQAILQGAPDGIKLMLARCEASPPGYEDRWNEILADFRSRSDAPVPLLRELKIAKPYNFLNEPEIGVFVTAHNSINAPVLPNPQFGGAAAVIRLSNVYFSKDRTLAVVRIVSFCGMLCAEGERKVFEKVEGVWREITVGPRCTVQA